LILAAKRYKMKYLMDTDSIQPSGIRIIKAGLFLPPLVGIIAGLLSKSHMNPHALVGAYCGFVVLFFLGIAALLFVIEYKDSPEALKNISEFAKDAVKVFIWALILCLPLGSIISCRIWDFGSEEAIAGAIGFCIPAVFMAGCAISIYLAIFAAAEIISSNGKIGGIGKVRLALIISLLPILLMIFFLFGPIVAGDR